MGPPGQAHSLGWAPGLWGDNHMGLEGVAILGKEGRRKEETLGDGMTGGGPHPKWERGSICDEKHTSNLRAVGPPARAGSHYQPDPDALPLTSLPRASPRATPTSNSLSLSCIPLGADQGLNDTPDDSLLLIPTHRMGPLFSSPGGIAVAKAIPRVPDLTLLPAARLHVPRPRATGPAGGGMQRGSLGKTGTPPTQSFWNKVPRIGQQDHPNFPGILSLAPCLSLSQPGPGGQKASPLRAGGPGPTASPGPV